MDLRGKNIIITGGAKGIGLCTARALSAENAKACIIDMDVKALMAVCDGESLFAYECDITDPSAVKETVSRCFSDMGAIHGLVNNAGFIYNATLINIFKRSPDEDDIEGFRKTIETNLNAVYYVTVHTAYKMLEKRAKGVIVNVSSISASGNAGQGAYSASKAGVAALTVAWAKELGPLGIRVAGIAPGYSKTETTMNSMADSKIKEWREATPLRRLAEPDEIAHGILFILKNDFYNGRILELDGGLRI